MSAGPQTIAQGVAAIEATNERTKTILCQVDLAWLARAYGPLTVLGPIQQVDLPFLVAEVLNAWEPPK